MILKYPTTHLRLSDIEAVKWWVHLYHTGQALCGGTLDSIQDPHQFLASDPVTVICLWVDKGVICMDGATTEVAHLYLPIIC